MTELAPTSDALSQLIQLHARKFGLSYRWTGVGRTDLDALCQDCSNKLLLSKALWEGLKELMDMKSVHDLPEDVQAKICAIVLTARTHFELSVERRNAKAQRGGMTPPAGVA
jgi:hypothetical protein